MQELHHRASKISCETKSVKDEIAYHELIYSQSMAIVGRYNEELLENQERLQNETTYLENVQKEYKL